MFNWFEGGMSAVYQRQYIESAQRFEDAPRLDERWQAALDLLDELANDPALNFLMTLQRGDIQSPGGGSARVTLNGVLHRARGARKPSPS